MADLLPSRPDISDDDKDPRVVGLDSDEVDDLLAAISSETARNALATLHDDPAPPSDVADRIDTSIQNAQYHLDRLETAGLIEAAGTAYSEKGREMTIYAPSDQALVVVAGSDDEPTGLQSALTQLLGGVGAVALGSVVVDRLARTGAVSAPAAQDSGVDGGGDGSGASVNDSVTAEPAVDPEATPTAEPTPTPTPEDDGGARIAEVTETPAPTEEPAATPTPAPESTPTETAADLAGTAVETTSVAGGGGSDPLASATAAVSGLPPGGLFFLGGLLALLFVTAVRLR